MKRFTYTFVVTLVTMPRQMPESFRLTFQADTDLEAMQQYCRNEQVQSLEFEEVGHVTMFAKRNEA
jgi:hypothetical protein